MFPAEVQQGGAPYVISVFIEKWAKDGDGRGQHSIVQEAVALGPVGRDLNPHSEAC